MTRAEHDAYWLDRYRQAGRHDMVAFLLTGDCSQIGPLNEMSFDEEREIDARLEAHAAERASRAAVREVRERMGR